MKLAAITFLLCLVGLSLINSSEARPAIPPPGGIPPPGAAAAMEENLNGLSEEIAKAEEEKPALQCPPPGCG